MPTYIGTNAEPVLSLPYFLLLFFYLSMGYPSRGQRTPTRGRQRETQQPVTQQERRNQPGAY